MIALGLRRLCRRTGYSPGSWIVRLAVLLCLTAAAALPAALAAHVEAVSARELSRSLAGAAPSERTVLITGSAATFREELYAEVQARLGPFLQDRLVIRYSPVAADALPAGRSAGAGQEVGRLDVYSFDALRENTHVVDGRLPDPIRLYEATGNWPPAIEAVAGLRAAEQSGVRVGDRLTGNNLYYRFDIVGLVEPIDPGSDMWGGDLRAFACTADSVTGTIGLPLIIAPQSMQAYLGRPVFAQEISWRVTLDTGRIGADEADSLRSELINLQNQGTTRGATIHTGLTRLLSASLARLARVSAPFLLLTVQSVLYALYALGVIAWLVVERARPEIALLSARGMGSGQIARAWGAQHLVVAVAAVVLGAGLAWGTGYLWSGSEAALPGRAWLLSAAVAAGGWLLLLVPAIAAARKHTPDPPPHALMPQATAVQKHSLDLYLLAFAAVLYWQLRQRGSFLMRQLGDTGAADPLLLIGPTLLLVAAAAVFVRVVPLLLRALAWSVRRLRGPVLSLAVRQAAYDRHRAGHVVLLSGLAAAILLFGRVSGDLLAQNRELLQATVPVMGVVSAFRLESVTILAFSVAALVVTGLLAGQGRRHELRTLNTLGLPAGAWMRIVIVEELVLLAVGLLVGSLAGGWLAHIMVPALYPALAGATSSAGVAWIAAEWPRIAGSCAVLFAVYGSALVLAQLARWHSHARAAGSIGDR